MVRACKSSGPAREQGNRGDCARTLRGVPDDNQSSYGPPKVLTLGLIGKKRVSIVAEFPPEVFDGSRTHSPQMCFRPHYQYAGYAQGDANKAMNSIGKNELLP
jgi:hypothetical protein